MRFIMTLECRKKSEAQCDFTLLYTNRSDVNCIAVSVFMSSYEIKSGSNVHTKSIFSSLFMLLLHVDREVSATVRNKA